MKKNILLLCMLILISIVGLSACATGGDKEPKENLSPVPGEKDEKYEVVLYYPDNDLLGTYRLKKEVSVRREEDLPKAALQAWIDGPEHEELTGLIRSSLIIEYVENVDGVAHVSFSKEINNNSLGTNGELMFAEQVAMIMQQFGFERTQILVEGRKEELIQGSLYIGEPFVANDPESYLWVDEKAKGEFVLQNVAFRIFEPALNSEVKDQIVVRGLARVFEATIQYEFEDGHFLFDTGFVTASEGAPGWGEFEIVIDLDGLPSGTARVILYEESAKDGSRLHEIQIPVVIGE
ncbi:GerMN domain-containing protein [Alkalicella caledoniensis]|uniref:GerMN domain-containing protein n=1 Tax=Alkalicella caledoniensis TaxID=2731377 RepID=A0A7G9W5V6_ALKCA|nr:Gmad2 immunoglobulin-like domain-containing protein [Alkalicella caledoniensis]QNO14068.1 GerMN domain-containing protein [Alkalicella caledoniensis]